MKSTNDAGTGPGQAEPYPSHHCSSRVLKRSLLHPPLLDVKELRKIDVIALSSPDLHSCCRLSDHCIILRGGQQTMLDEPLK